MRYIFIFNSYYIYIYINSSISQELLDKYNRKEHFPKEIRNFYSFFKLKNKKNN